MTAEIRYSDEPFTSPCARRVLVAGGIIQDGAADYVAGLLAQKQATLAAPGALDPVSEIRAHHGPGVTIRRAELATLKQPKATCPVLILGQGACGRRIAIKGKCASCYNRLRMREQRGARIKPPDRPDITADLIIAGQQNGQSLTTLARVLGVAQSVLTSRLKQYRDAEPLNAERLRTLATCDCGRQKWAHLPKCSRCVARATALAAKLKARGVVA